MNVTELMSTPVITINAESNVEEAAKIMINNGVSCLPVLNKDDQIVGILTHTDFGFHKKYLPMANHLYTLMGSWVDPETLENVAKHVSSKIIKDVMIQPVITVQETTSVAEVAALMMAKKINRVPVLKGMDLIGIITRNDFMKLMIPEKNLG
jgi:CBS domain-containing protein